MCYTIYRPRPYEVTPGLVEYYANIRNKLIDEIESGEVRAQAFPTVTGFFNETLYPMVWGLRPDWSEKSGKSKEGRLATLNCISEEMFNKVSFRDLAATNRCLIPVKYFVEWRHESNGKKTKYQISIDGSNMMYLGGLCQFFEDSIYFTICTQAANDIMSFVHNTKKRMPVVIMPACFDKWLSPGSIEQIADIIKPNNDLPLKTIIDSPPVQQDLFA